MYKQGKDFIDNHPKACAIYTTCPKREITDRWIFTNMRMSLIMYHAKHYHGKPDTDAFDGIIVNLLNNNCVRILTDVNSWSMTPNNESKFGDDLIEILGFSRENYRIVRSWASDLENTMKQPNLLCWFF